MGSLRKNFAGLVGVKRKDGSSGQMTQDQAIAQGFGRMVDGVYQAYSDADRDHIQSANANANAAYTDISSGSALGRNFGSNETILSGIRKKKNIAQTLLGGGNSSLGG